MAPTEIITGVWICDKNDLEDTDFIINKKIKIIINCTRDLDYDYRGNKIKFIRIPLENLSLQESGININHTHYNEILFNSLKKIIPFIHKALMKHINIILTCHTGIQNSCSIIAGYIIKYGEVDVYQAIKYIKTKRSKCFKPKIDFEKGLLLYQKHLNML